MSDNKKSSSKPGLPTVFDEDEERIEVSKITSFEDLYRKMEKVERISLSTRSKVKAIPDLTRELSKLTGLHESIEHRVNRLESRHHDCDQVDAINQIQTEILSTREDHSEIVRVTEKLGSLSSVTEKVAKSVKNIETNKAHNLYYVASLAIANIAILVSAAWFLSAMNSDVKSIQQEISSQNKIEANDVCRQMTNEDKSRISKTFSGKQIPYNCIPD